MKMARISPRVQHLKERRCPIQSPSSSNSSLNGHARIQAPQASHFSISGTGKSKPPFFMTILPYGQHKTHLPQPVQRIEATISATLFKGISSLSCWKLRGLSNPKAVQPFAADKPKRSGISSSLYTAMP